MYPNKKSRIRSAFDKSAPNYDRYAHFQNKIAIELWEKIAELKLSEAVGIDMGCGTGGLAARLIDSGAFKKVLAYDISMGMALKAMERRNGLGGLYVAQGDAELMPVKNESVDLIASNLVFQWISTLPAVWRQAANALKTGGRLMATTLGTSTFKELRQAVSLSFEKAGKPVDRINFHRFTDEQALINSASVEGFDIRTEKKIHFLPYKDVYDFMRELKRIGVQVNSGFSWLGLGRRDMLQSFANHYRENFPLSDGIGVTYEVIHIDAVKTSS